MMCLTVVVTNAVLADGAMQENRATGQLGVISRHRRVERDVRFMLESGHVRACTPFS